MDVVRFHTPAWAAKYVGAPYLDQGRSIIGGLDCWGLVCEVYKNELGIELPSYLEAYSSAQDVMSCADAIADKRRSWVEVEEPRAFDVIEFRVRGYPWHVGVALNGDGEFLHTMRSIDTVVENWKNPKWRPRVLSFLRLPR